VSEALPQLPVEIKKLQTRRTASWCSPCAGLFSVPWLGSIAAAASPKTLRVSPAMLWHSSGLHQSAWCSESFATQHEPFGQSL